MTVEQSIAAAIKSLAENDRHMALSHMLDAQNGMWASRYSWRGDRNSPEAIWYRQVPCDRPPEPL